jgi:hypothetical protein
VKHTQDRASLQERIAALAAQRIVDDGDDTDRAKRKAAAALLGADARAAGALPDDAQLGAALRAYLRETGGAAHRAWLLGRRRAALAWMERLSPFDPHLVGSALDASATDASPVEIDLFADSAKDVEMALFEMEVDFRAGEPDGRQRHALERIGFVDARTGHAGGPERAQGTAYLLTVLAPVAQRSVPPARRGPDDPELHPIERLGRASAANLRRLIDATSPDAQPSEDANAS